MKTPDKQIRDKLLLMCEKAPEYLSRACHRLLHDNEQPGYEFFLKDFIEEIHLIAGRNVGLLCEAWAKAIMEHRDRGNSDTTNDYVA